MADGSRKVNHKYGLEPQEQWAIEFIHETVRSHHWTRQERLRGAIDCSIRFAHAA